MGLIKQKNPYYLEGLERAITTTGLDVSKRMKALEKQRCHRKYFEYMVSGIFQMSAQKNVIQPSNSQNLKNLADG